MSMELYEKIVDECRRRELSVTRVMQNADVSVSMLYRWRDGESKPRPRSLKAIARALGILASTLSSDLSDDAEVVASATLAPEARGDSQDSTDFAFFGMPRSAFNALRPFIERAHAGIVEVPADLTKALLNLLKDPTSLLGVESQSSLVISF